MPAYQIHRLRESARLQFRNAPHTAGAAIVKQKDYEQGAMLEASSPYAAWMALRESSDALQVGDLLELQSGELRIFKYIGFEEARWYVLEPANASDAQAIAVT